MDVNPRDVINNFELLLRAENDASGFKWWNAGIAKCEQHTFWEFPDQTMTQQISDFRTSSHFFDGNSKSWCLNTRLVAPFHISDLEFRAEWIRGTLRYVRLGVQSSQELPRNFKHFGEICIDALLRQHGLEPYFRQIQSRIAKALWCQVVRLLRRVLTRDVFLIPYEPSLYQSEQGALSLASK